MAKNLLITGVWEDATLEPFGVANYMNYQDFSKHTLVMSIFFSRGEARLVLDTHPSTYRQIMQYPPVTFAAQNREVTTDYFSIAHIQENHYSFKCFSTTFDGYADLVDILLGPYEPESMPTSYNNYFKMPLYARMLYQKYGIPTVSQIQAELEQMQLARQDVLKRPEYAALIARHDRFSLMPGVRTQLVKIFNQVFAHKVCCAGALLHNDDRLKMEYSDQKLTYLKRFIFNICPENTYAPGYVTEKLWHALEAGCIPIFWGGGYV